jgi:hypothetical protein
MFQSPDRAGMPGVACSTGICVTKRAGLSNGIEGEGVAAAADLTYV